MKTLILTYPHSRIRDGKEVYKVKQIEQDVSIKPHDLLDEQQVKDMCEQTGVWKVIIRPAKLR